MAAAGYPLEAVEVGNNRDVWFLAAFDRDVTVVELIPDDLLESIMATL